jgi:hypothetical protein
MGRTSGWPSAVVVAAALVLGCTENISAPGRCPALCPTGNVVLADTLLTAPVTSDTSVRGYVGVREAGFMLISSLDTLKSVALIRLLRVDSTWFVTGGSTVDTAYIGHIDSLVLLIHVAQRDTAAKNLRLLVYRLPANFDTGATYASIAPYFADSTVMDTIPIPDSLVAGDTMPLHVADNLVIPAADTNVVSLGFAVLGASPTAFAIQSGSLGTASPLAFYYVHAKAPLDTVTKEISVEPNFWTFVTSPAPAQPPSGVLALGGLPTARSTLYLSLPKIVVDSNAVVRATLLLNAVQPAGGFARDSFWVSANPVVRDYGTKSVLYPDSAISGNVLIHQGQSGPVELDIAPILRFWGTTVGDSTPRLIVLRVYPEGSILGSVAFQGAGTGPGSPQLRVTYVKPYQFGVP